jgi:hypothetical protein
LGSGFESDADVVIPLDPSTKIDQQIGMGCESFQYSLVDDLPAPGTVKVNQVQVPNTSVLERLGNFQGVFVIYLFGAVIPFGEADTFPVYDINRRYYSHFSRKF